MDESSYLIDKIETDDSLENFGQMVEEIDRELNDHAKDFWSV